MASNKKNKAYAIAIYEISKELKIIPKVRDEAKILLDIFENDEKLEMFLSKVKISQEDRKEFISKVFDKQISKPLINTIKLLIDKNKTHMIKGILEETITTCNYELGIIEGIVYTTIKLTKEELVKIENKISKKIGKKIQLNNKINNFIIGGIKVVLQDNVWDYTIINKINNLSQSIKSKELI